MVRGRRLSASCHRDGQRRLSNRQPHEWVTQIAPYANFALKVLATVAPIAAPAINTFFGRQDNRDIGTLTDQLDLANAIIGKLPAEIKTPTVLYLRGKCSANRSGLASWRCTAS